MALRQAPLMLLGCSTVRAFPSFRDFMPNGRRVPCPENGQECQAGDPAQCEAELTCSGLGHRTCKGGTLPLNVFGEAFEDAGHTWTQELCEADSDGDGLSNGEELGDPCCLWVKGSAPSEYTKRFAPSHPGVADSSATLAAYSRPACGDTGPVVTGQRFGEFNDNEEQMTVDIRIKSHNVPAQRTSYINFMLNIPDSAWAGHPSADMFYVVKGETLIDKKEVLHHYIINGCSKKVPEELDGVPTSARTNRDYDCTTPFAGWAPGAYIVNMPPWIGVPFGPNAGVVAFDVQIHYDNPREASDIWDASGMRFSYTPTPRQYPMSLFQSLKVSVNEQIVVPPKKARWFLTRTCTIDVSDDMCDINGRFRYNQDGQTYEMDLARDDSNAVTITALTANSFSVAWGTYSGGELAVVFDNGAEAAFDVHCDKTGTQMHWRDFDWPAWIMSKAPEPVEFHLFGVSYHAHLLGVEMYTEYFPLAGGDPVDLGSEHLWYFDDQYTRDLLALNITMRAGDVLQSTCVMNSMHLEEATIFGRETIDEMCWAAYMGWSSVPGHSASVTCDGPVWQGELLQTEPVFGIAKHRPVEKATSAWDGSDSLTGGVPIRLPGGACVDTGFPSAICTNAPGTLELLGTSGCDQDLATIAGWNAYPRLHGQTFTQMCCATACAHQACHTTPICLDVKEQELQAQGGLDVSNTIALSFDPLYSIRTMGCSSDAGMIKTVSIRLPDELLMEGARTQGFKDGDASFHSEGEGEREMEAKQVGEDAASSIGCICLFLPLFLGLTA